MSRRDELRLADIDRACRKIVRWIQPRSRDIFFDDEMAYDATIRNLEIIGEAAGQLDPALRDRFSDVPWRQIIAFRHRAVHEYFGLDDDGVWNIVTEGVPQLLIRIEVMISELAGE